MTRAHPLENRIPPPVVAFAVLLAELAAARWVPAAQFGPIAARPDLAPLQLAGIALGVAGLAAMAAGVLAFRRKATTVDPLHPEKATSVVTGGIFRFTRNPMYLGMALILLSVALVLSNALALLGPLLFAAWITRFQIRPEERALEHLFGAEFRNYRARVRRWL
ncbi:MAG: isoprenylcysteine carboxylmethyltransferase family protein [Erythrobacter sp.]|nr:MAG: isoprenylcysteine carboxylmethyltransferase family protein [Erythrobacter sp.]